MLAKLESSITLAPPLEYFAAIPIDPLEDLRHEGSSRLRQPASQVGKSGALETAAASMPPGVELVLFDGLRELPHFNPDIEATGLPESVTQWRLALTASNAVLIASPDYGFSLPGVLKNGIDWVIGSGELEEKVVAITAVVAGSERGRRGLQALRDTLSAVRATIVGGEPITKGPGLETQVAALVQALVEATASSRDHSRVDGA